MMATETLKCTVPSVDAVKDAVIYCVTNPTNATEISTSIATWATALITLGLLVGAWLAWRSSIRQLEIAKKTEETTFKGMQAQILASEAATSKAIQNSQLLAKEEQQLASVSNYLTALYSMRATARGNRAQAEEALQELVRAGILWRLNYGINNESKTFTLLESSYGLLVVQTTSLDFNEDHDATERRRRKVIEDTYDGMSKELPRFHRKETDETELLLLFGLLLMKLLEEAPEVKDMIPD